MSGDLIDTTEMYLKTVFELHEAGIAPMRARIAERLGHSGPTVSQTVARMERDGLLYLDDQRRIRLTDEGSDVATDVMRKHRLAERHLLDVIGLDYAHVHEEACRWEHVMSLEVEKRIAQQVAPPYLDPYGNPIPGLAALGIEETQTTREGKDHSIPSRELSESVDDGQSLRVRLARIGERIQSDVELLGELARHGILPGAEMSVERVGGSIMLAGPDGGEVAVTELVADQLHVTSLVAG
ncbi:MAG: iron dependent repressor, metal binding and dimerization domain protein [Brachybacterium sp.]|uniref:metal-dependent transcriptional regulator n=1 Tax=Brachybacterium sp. TaxID=1891286 RepID=UPI002652794C|nr:metal-dependent transcriptional regulator [Brachybacterium sp.]MDN6304053.1 metal-dependent transcriptional regulator [Brachybacterium sp.]MDN6330032.1 metal-dependent transcriptional regulator [Brachybacterium sp.]MDN6400061.1 metal-dependent transcriptional regulator [Brachybacterium sp.]